MAPSKIVASNNTVVTNLATDAVGIAGQHNIHVWILRYSMCLALQNPRTN
jgi:hypothetical protein